MHAENRQWFEQLFDDEGRRFLRQLAARFKDGTEADDLAQEVYLRLLRADDALVIRDPRSFAIKVASNVACEWGRLSRHRRPHLQEQVLDAQASARPEPIEQAALDQQAKAVTQALQRLSPMRRAVVLLRFRDGLSYSQIAERVGLSVSMVYKHLSKGTEACQGGMKAGAALQEDADD